MLEHQLAKTRVLFVCMGNVCRSPVAQAVFEKKLTQSGLAACIEVDSAGTGDHHVGQKPDSRSQHAAAFRGYSLIGQVARQITAEDFDHFDMILAMDWQNMRELQNLAPPQHRHKIELVMRYAQNSDDAEVPDPYYEEQHAFNKVVDYLEDAATGLLDVVKRRAPQPVAA
ncbi:low molecular weight protein-tyrosine-phosphatase [Ephemeroptericola cinctiostellae]|nr:low molecular weight protein-tyrosine-phosphatase [Ephemeroptericola cinctiostellae]